MHTNPRHVVREEEALRIVWIIHAWKNGVREMLTGYAHTYAADMG